MSGQGSSKNILCRFCLETLDSQPKIEDIDEVITDINYIFNLEISDQDLWPKRICNTCKQKSRDCIEFFHKIKKGEEKLLKLFGEKFRVMENEVAFFDVVEIKKEILEDVNLLEVDADDKLKEEENIGSPINPFTPMVFEEECKKEEVIDQKKTVKRTYKKKQPKDDDTKIAIPMKPGKKEALARNNEVVKQYLGFKCDLCYKELKSYHALAFHFRSAHNQKGYMICCLKKFTNLRHLSDHVKLHIDPETYKCPNCSKIFKRGFLYNMHVRGCMATPDKFTIICEICSEAFPTPILLYRHRRMVHMTEDQKRHQCPHCNKRFLMPSHLKNHISGVHEKIKPFVCDMCGRGYHNKSSVEEHIKKTHLKEQQPKIKCQDCGKQFIEVHYKDHRTRCNVPSVKCTICGHTYKNPLSLKYHIKGVHEGWRGKIYKCDICSKTFSAKRKLLDHIAKHQGIPRQQCNFCDKQFFSFDAKSVHHRKVHPKENEAAKKAKNWSRSGGIFGTQK